MTGTPVWLSNRSSAARGSGAEADRTNRTPAGRGDGGSIARIAVRHADPLEYATALVAIVAAGRVAVPLDPGAPPAEAERVVAVARAAATGDSGIFLCTSGTTGTPKGILLRDEQLTHTAASVVAAHRLTRDDRGYCSLPLFHVNAEVVGLLATLRAGAYLAIDRKFSRRGFWELIAERRITWINAVPAIISILAMDPPAPRPARVRFVRSASAPLSLAALERFESQTGVPVIETYGMTEAASMITANPLGARKPGSAGRPAGSEVRIEAPDGTSSPAAPGDIGRVRIRGGGVIRAYASGGRPGAIDGDGWLDTGDLGYLDADGYLFLAGRCDDVINRGGEKIYPREIEEFLLTQPGVGSPRSSPPATRCSGSGRSPTWSRLRTRAGPAWRTRCARRARRNCPGPSGPPSPAWCRSCPWARRARSPGAACGN